MEETFTQNRFPSGIVISNPKAPSIPGNRKKRPPNLVLKTARINAGLSPRELGDLSGVVSQTIRNAERFGTVPHPRNQLAIAIAPDCKPSDLFAGKRHLTR